MFALVRTTPRKSLMYGISGAASADEVPGQKKRTLSIQPPVPRANACCSVYVFHQLGSMMTLVGDVLNVT
ncbi:hypothetical protein Trydic_g12462 [Trypoxylus dichotomus]